MAGIVHFARFFVFMETAEHEFLRRVGTPVHFAHQGTEVGWPRLAASCRYLSPARLGEVLDIHLRVKRKGRRAMTYAVTFSSAGRTVAEGEISSIFCALPWKPASEGAEERRPQPLPIPSRLADKIDEDPGLCAPPNAGEQAKPEPASDPRRT